MSTNTSTREILPVSRDVWVQPEQNRREIQSVPPVAKTEGSTARKVSDEKRDQGSGASFANMQQAAQMADQVNSYLNELNVNLNFRVDEQTSEVVVQVLNQDTGELIRQIPPEEVVKMKEKLEELRGILLDSKV